MALKVITKESLWAAQREALQTVMDVLFLREHHARTLLIHYRWDVEKLITVYFEKGKSRMFSEAGVSMVEHVHLNLPESSSKVICNICMDDVPAKDMTTMGCGHCFCNNCWTEHFIVKINEGQSKRIRCMAYKCNTICDETIVRNLVSVKHPDLAEKFEWSLLTSYIEDNKMVKWCPSIPHCGNAIRVENDEFCEVECSCGVQFCFSCSSEAHSPCSCSMWELWTQKCHDESETVNWITVNTMPCPKCHKAVEKNGGCSIVRCVCGQAFCWLCGEARGLGHSCGRYKEDKEKEVQRAKRFLYRYMHYYNRYKAHSDSLKQESCLKEAIQYRVSKLEAWELKIRDFRWATKGLYRLLRSRRFLSYSYPFAFYMFGDDLFKDEMTENVSDIKQHLFEDHQQQLESTVEKLSQVLQQVLEEPFDEYPEQQVVQINIQVIDLCVITDSLCKKMYEYIENDLLGSLQYNIHIIAPYHSRGIQKAEELIAGDLIEKGQTSASGSLKESQLSSWKQPRKESSAGAVFDLELSAEASRFIQFY